MGQTYKDFLKAGVALAVIMISLLFVSRALKIDARPYLDRLRIKDKYLNQAILDEVELLRGLPRTYRVKPRPDDFGTLRAIEYANSLQIPANETGDIYCVGIILDVYMHACSRAAGDSFRLAGVDRSNFRQFRRDFYGYDGNQRTFVDALASRGLGEELTDLAQVAPGDLVQFWRQRSGHSAVFLRWEWKNGEVAGMTFFSAHSETGLSDKTEYFRGKGGGIDPERLYFVRALTP